MPTVSVAIQCSLVELPELTILPTLETSMFEFLKIEKNNDDFLQSSFSENVNLQTNLESENFKQLDVPKIHHDPNVFVLGLSPIKTTLPENVTLADNEDI